MTDRDDIIRMARDAGFTLSRAGGRAGVEWVYTEMLERFFHDAYAAGAAAGMEACAKLIESRKTGASELMDAVRDMEAAAIRKMARRQA